MFQVQQPASKWEFYICNEIENRLGALREPVDVVGPWLNIVFENITSDCMIKPLKWTVPMGPDKQTVLLWSSPSV